MVIKYYKTLDKSEKQRFKGCMILFTISLLLGVIGFFNLKETGVIVDLTDFTLLAEISDDKINYEIGEDVNFNVQVLWYEGGWDPAYIGDKAYYQLDEQTPIKFIDHSELSGGSKLLSVGDGNKEILELHTGNYTIFVPESSGTHEINIYYFVHKPSSKPQFIVDNWDLCEDAQEIVNFGDCEFISVRKKVLRFNVIEEPTPYEPECTADDDCDEGFVCEDEECVMDSVPKPTIWEQMTEFLQSTKGIISMLFLMVLMGGVIYSRTKKKK